MSINHYISIVLEENIKMKGKISAMPLFLSPFLIGWLSDSKKPEPLEGKEIVIWDFDTFEKITKDRKDSLTNYHLNKGGIDFSAICFMGDVVKSAIDGLKEDCKKVPEDALEYIDKWFPVFKETDMDMNVRKEVCKTCQSSGSVVGVTCYCVLHHSIVNLTHSCSSWTGRSKNIKSK